MRDRRDPEPHEPPPTVFVVDDDPAMRESLSWLLQAAGLTVESFESAEHYLEQRDPRRAGCLLLDLKLPGKNGLELQNLLTAANLTLPIIFLTGYAEVSTAVRALKGGAFDFLEKPFRDEILLDCVKRALERDSRNRQALQHITTVTSKLERLSRREREVMELMVQGKPTKEIAGDLGLSPKTVEVHRGRVMRKMEVRALPQLVRQVMEARRARPL